VADALIHPPSKAMRSVQRQEALDMARKKFIEGT